MAASNAWAVAVIAGTGVAVGASVGVTDGVRVRVGVGVLVGIGVSVARGVSVGDGTDVTVGVGVGLAVGVNTDVKAGEVGESIGSSVGVIPLWQPNASMTRTMTVATCLRENLRLFRWSVRSRLRTIILSSLYCPVEHVCRMGCFSELVLWAVAHAPAILPSPPRYVYLKEHTKQA